MAQPKRRSAGQVSGENLVIEVAWLYYNDGLNQQEIAERLGVSRASVANYLQEARERDFIRIRLHPAAFTAHRMAVDLCQRFGLAAAYVLPDDGADTETIFRRVARGAADWLPDLLAEGDMLGLAWGRTMFEMAERSDPHPIADLTVVQLVGSMATPYGFSSEACSTRLAQNLCAKCINLHAPAIVSRASLAAELRHEPIIAAQLAFLDQCNKFVFSAGTCQPDSHIVGSGMATLDDLAWYVDRGATGVICGRFIDARGRPIAGPMDDRMIGIELDRLQGLSMGILVVPGHDKIAATRAAIRGGFVTHLATSASIAEALLAQPPDT